MSEVFYPNVPVKQRRHRVVVRPEWVVIKADRYVVPVIVILFAVAVIYGISQIDWSLPGVSSVPWWVWSHTAVFVFGIRRGIRTGRRIQAVAHSYFGVFKGHMKLINKHH